MTERSDKNTPAAMSTHQNAPGERALTIDINGATVSYKKSGAGPPLIYFHGWIGNEDSFAPCHREFARHFTVYRPAWPGYGGSTSVPDFTIEEIIEIANEFIIQLGLSDVTIMANCLGGNLAIELARRYPRHICRMVLIEVHAYFPLYFYLLLVPGLNRLLYTTLLKSMSGLNFLNLFFPLKNDEAGKRKMYAREGFLRTSVDSALDFIRAMYRFSRKKEAQYIQRYRSDIPVLYVKGGKTFRSVRKFTEHVNEFFTDLQIVSMPESMHNPVAEQPELFSRLVLDAMGYDVE